MKSGLVLEGGAMRGLFTAGVIDVWMTAGITFDRNVVVTTRPHGYRKFASWKVALTKIFLRRYPAVYRALATRHEWYNRTLEYIDRRVADGAALLVCPEAPLPIARVCHDPEAMQWVYDLGKAAGERSAASVKEFLK